MFSFIESYMLYLIHSCIIYSIYSHISFHFSCSYVLFFSRNHSSLTIFWKCQYCLAVVGGILDEVMYIITPISRALTIWYFLQISTIDGLVFACVHGEDRANWIIVWPLMVRPAKIWFLWLIVAEVLTPFTSFIGQMSELCSFCLHLQQNRLHDCIPRRQSLFFWAKAPCGPNPTSSSSLRSPFRGRSRPIQGSIPWRISLLGPPTPETHRVNWTQFLGWCCLARGWNQG